MEVEEIKDESAPSLEKTNGTAEETTVAEDNNVSGIKTPKSVSNSHEDDISEAPNITDSSEMSISIVSESSDKDNETLNESAISVSSEAANAEASVDEKDSKAEETPKDVPASNGSTTEDVGPPDLVAQTESVDAETKEDNVAQTENVDQEIKGDNVAQAENVDEETKGEDVAQTDNANQETKDDDAKPSTSKEEVEEMDTTEKETEHENKQEQKKDAKKEKKKSKNCVECGKKGKKFRLHYQGQNHNLCSEVCYKAFKMKLSSSQKAAEPAPPAAPTVAVEQKCAQCTQIIKVGLLPTVGSIKPVCSEECRKKYQEEKAPPESCAQCRAPVPDAKEPGGGRRLVWETQAFCGEECLGARQAHLGSHCTCCHQPVQPASLGKYCVCFGADIRQFCSGSCLEDFKRGLKVCSFCQTDLSSATDGFLAPVGDKGQFKDFCSPKCMERYELLNNISNTVPESQECSHCHAKGNHAIRVTHQSQKYSLCSDSCVAGFRCAFNLSDNICDTCYKIFQHVDGETISFKLDGMHRHFCSKPCSTIYVLTKRRITQCVQCKVKKYNTDMIEKTDPSSMFCSLNCLSLWRASTTSGSVRAVRCDQCSSMQPAQYHLTMSDGSLRSFCNYACVLAFQNQFHASVPALTAASSVRQHPAPAGPGRPALKTTSAGTNPVIANVVSLAAKGSPMLAAQSRPQINSPKPQMQSTGQGRGSSSSGSGREVIVRPPAPKSLKNKAVSCKPIMQTKGVSAKMHTCHKAVQTDDSPTPIILPIPIPIYVPLPMHMFSRPVPCPVPFPIPIPVPLLLPTGEKALQVIKDKKLPPTETNTDTIADKKEPPVEKDHTATNDSSAKSENVVENNISQENNHEKGISSASKIKEEILTDISESDKEIFSEEDFVSKDRGKRPRSPSSEQQYSKKSKLDAESQPPVLFRETFSEDPEKNLKVH